MEPQITNIGIINEWEALLAAENEKQEEAQESNLNQQTVEDNFEQPDQVLSDKVTSQAVAQEGRREVNENLGVGFEETEESTETRPSYDLNGEQSRGDYENQLIKDFQQQLGNIKEGDMAAFKQLLEDTGARIQADMKNGTLNQDGKDFSKADFLNAVQMMEEAQRKTLDRLANKAANAGIGNSNNRTAEDKAFYDALKRQARIDKWETLKDQQYVYYLKATLAGIKASEKLAASAR